MKNDLLPCKVNATVKCATCSMHHNGCPVESSYDVIKAIYSIRTNPKAGVNVQELVKAKFPKLYKDLHLNGYDWENDLDGILDFLYGERQIGIFCFLLNICKSDITELINFIESNCEVHRG